MMTLLRRFGYACLTMIIPLSAGALTAADLTADPAATVRIDGLWESECVVDEDGQSIKQAAMFLQNPRDEVSFTMTHYLDEDCTQEAFSFDWRAAYGVRTEEAPGTYPIDFMLRTISVTPLSEGQVELFNAARFCDLRGWELGKKKIVTGKVCGGNQLGRSGFLAYNRFKIDDNGNRLHLDFNASSRSPENRPAPSEFAFQRIQTFACTMVLEQQNPDGSWEYLSTETIEIPLNRSNYSYRRPLFHIESSEQSIGLYIWGGLSSKVGKLFSVQVRRLYGDQNDPHYGNPHRNSDLIMDSRAIHGDGSAAWTFENYVLKASCKSTQ